MAYADNFDFSGKTVLITGGATGIGAGIGRLFAENGAHVIVAARRPEVMEEFAQGCPGTASWVKMDVRSEDDRQAAVATAIERTGRLDVLVNNALSFIWGPFEDQPLDDTLEMYDVLLVGPTRLIHAAIPALKASKGCVINVSSVVGRAVPEAVLINPVYSAAKAGINQLTRTLAVVLGPAGVRINAVAPGATLPEKYEDPDYQRMITDATALGRIGTAEDVAKATLFLASDAAGWVTGQVLDASGGWNLSG